MTSTLPSRWQEILRREAAANVGTVLAQAREQPDPRRVPRWTVPVLVVGVASVSLFGLFGGTAAKGKGNLPFDRSTVISTRTAGSMPRFAGPRSALALMKTPFSHPAAITAHARGPT